MALDGALQYCAVERQGHVTLVTLRRPEVMNALHAPAHQELHEVFDDFAADPEQWVAIITGAGERAFSAGNDLKHQAAGGALTLPPTGFAGLSSRYDLDKPIIAAVNGVAYGGGFEIALACDLVIASETASFSLPEPKVGLAALAGGLHRLPRQIGLKAAMGIILTGRTVSAEEGLALGIVNAVTAPQDLMSEAARWAAMICACSPVAIRASKQVASRGLRHADLQAAIAERYPAVRDLFKSADFKEGPRAFAERRAPVWAGR